jgi:CheY-like chemotaxis protein
LSWIRQDHRPLRDTPIVILSGSDRSDDIVRAYAFGANAYFHKPSSSSELQSMLQKIVAASRD